MVNYAVKKTIDHEKESARTIEIEISVEEIGKHRAKSLKTLSEKADLAGFRKGHVPEKVILEKLGEAGILEEAINSWLKEALPEILQKEAVGALALPRVNITKVVPGNPVELSLFIPLRPALKLPAYKEIAAARNKKKELVPEVSEKEIDEAILRLREYAARAVNPQLPTKPKENELPPLSDQFAESVGGGKTVAELRERIKKDLAAENKNRAKEKNRLAILEEILKKTEGAIPNILIDYEVERVEAEFEGEVKRAGLSLENYLKGAKKTLEDLRKDWRPAAEERAKVNLILDEIKKLEKLEADGEKVEREVKHFLEHYKNADPEQVKAYMDRTLSDEKVFEWLESQ
jgi:FKBP-type peptidyl-prolyl cis-trans isomerase (trigger factor)